MIALRDSDTNLLRSEGGDSYGRAVSTSGKVRSDLEKCPGLAEWRMAGLGIAVG